MTPRFVLDRLADEADRVDVLDLAARAEFAARAAHARADLSAVAPRLRPEILSDRIHRAEDRLASLWRLAELAHPERPLKRGFARVTDRMGRTLTQAAEAVAAKALTLRFGDGAVDATTESEPKRAARVESSKGRSYVTPQRGLFDEPEE